MGLRIALAGRISIRNDGVLIEEERLPGRQGRLVFAYLVSEHARPVTRNELAEALWGETPPASWEKALGVIASKLRVVLGDSGLDGAKALTSAFGCYRLELPKGAWVDILAAEQAVDQAEAALASGDVEGARAEAATAASLVRLPLLPGEDGSWVTGRRRQLADVHVRAVEALADACLRSGDTAEAAKWATEAIRLEPFRESGYRHLMRAHAAAGNRAEALRVYERCRRLLSEELGAYPSPETESIYRDMLKLSPASDDAAPADEPAQRPWRATRGVMVAATLVGAAIAAALAVLLVHGSGSTSRTAIEADAVGVIDPEDGEVAAGIPVGAAPAEVAVGADAVWATSSDGNSVSRIDPSTNVVRQTIRVSGSPAGIAVGAGAVWVADGLEGTVSRIDPATNQVVQTITVGNGPTGVSPTGWEPSG
jgi:YVTN family beta-propeller protein